VGGWNSPHVEARDQPLVPPVLTASLDGLTLVYPRLSNDVGESTVYPYWNPLSWCSVEICKARLDLRSSFECSPRGEIMITRIGPLNCSLGRLGRFPLRVSQRLVRLLVMLVSSSLTTASVGSAAKGEEENTWRLSRRCYFAFQKFICMPWPRSYFISRCERCEPFNLLSFSQSLRPNVSIGLIDRTGVERTDEVYVTKPALSQTMSLGRSEFLSCSFNSD
jgi:hypothetical protein